MLKKLEVLEKGIDQNLERLFSQKLFLQVVSSVLNANSYRKILLNQTLSLLWKSLQLPNKRDQERTLHLIHELNHRLRELENRVSNRRVQSTGASVTTKVVRRSTRKKNDELASGPVAIQ